MIGDTEFFDELSGTEFEVIATVLLAMCLVILTIMMLNLLVAVLTTAYAKVDENADQEFKVRQVSRSALSNQTAAHLQTYTLHCRRC